MWGEEKERLYGHSWDKQTLYTVYILGEGEEEQLHLAVSICYFKLKYALLLSLWHIICLVSCSALLSLRFIAFEGSQDWRIQFFLHFFFFTFSCRHNRNTLTNCKGENLSCKSVIKCSVLLHFHLFAKAKSRGSEDKKSLVRFKPTSQTNCHVLLPTQLSSHAVKVILKPLLLEMILGLGLN